MKHPLYILCTIKAIVLYGLAHPHQISSFSCCNEDTSAYHLTRISIKNAELPNSCDRAKVAFNFKPSG